MGGNSHHPPAPASQANACRAEQGHTAQGPGRAASFQPPGPARPDAPTPGHPLLHTAPTACLRGSGRGLDSYSGFRELDSTNLVTALP